MQRSISNSPKIKDQSSQFDIVWLTEHAEAALDENITLGAIVARLSVAPPDPRM